MPKQGMHENDHNDQRKSKGPNNPSKSVTITTGSAKKKETYASRARQGKHPEPVAQHDKNEWREDTHEAPSHKDQIGDSSRTGSDSNEDTHTRGH